MEKKKGPAKTYVYFLVSIILLILIFAEVAEIGQYHSSSGTLNVEVAYHNQTDAIVIAKLPGVSVNAIMYLISFIPPYENISYSVPENTSVASVTLSDFNNTTHTPSIAVRFNSTSSVRSAVAFVLDGHLDINLTASKPVYIMVVPESELPGLFPSIVKTPEYDYLVIHVNDVWTLSYTEVSR